MQKTAKQVVRIFLTFIGILCSFILTQTPATAQGNLSWDLPEGMILLGDFDPLKPTIVSLNGWRIERTADNFINLEGWQSAGFNTILYRWHKDAYDDTLCTIFGVIKMGCPKKAESRVWGDGVFSGRKFVQRYKDFFSQYPHYAQEIRIATTSLGSQISTYLAYVLYEEMDEAIAKPVRLEMIDTFAGNAQTGTGGTLPSDTDFPIPEDQDIPGGSPCHEYNRTSTYCVMENALFILKNRHNLAIVNYSSSIGGATTYGFRKFLNFQGFHDDWLCSRHWFQNKADCGPLFKGGSVHVIAGQHVFPQYTYYWSISEPYSANLPFSAATPTQVILSGTRFFRQKPVANYCETSHGKSLGDILTVIVNRTDISNVSRFADAIVQGLGINRETAMQCAEAVSFMNDEFVELDVD